jgi:hypothetical protein
VKRAELQDVAAREIGDLVKLERVLATEPTPNGLAEPPTVLELDEDAVLEGKECESALRLVDVVAREVKSRPVRRDDGSDVV